jgi:copper transport protein
VRLRRLATWGAGVAAGTAAADFLLQGPYAAGSGLGSVLDPALISATLGSLAGRAMLVRAVLAVALLFLLRPAWRSGTAPSVAVASGAGVLGLGICLSTALVGHAAAGSSTALALTVTTVHVAAMTVWLGGLAGLLAAVLRSDVPPRELAAAMPVFSRLAFGSVVALVVTGTLQAVREVGSVDALSTTAYGRLLLAKLALVILILAAAGVSRVWVQQHLGSHRARPGALRRVSAMAFAGGPPAPPAQESEVVETAAALRAAAQAEGAVVALPHLRRSVLVEFGCAIAVLAVTAVLVGSAPAKNAVSQPVDRTLALQGTNGSSGSIEVSIDPARPGPNSLHLYLFDAQGRLTQPEAIQLSLAEKEQQIGPIQVPLLPGGPGHYIADTNIVKAGTWTLTVVVRVDEFTATTASTVFSVR